MSPLRSLYNHPIRKNFIRPRGITYTLCAGGLGGGDAILKDKISKPFNYAGQKGYLKIFIRCGLGIDGQRGAFCPPINFDY